MSCRLPLPPKQHKDCDERPKFDHDRDDDRDHCKPVKWEHKHHHHKPRHGC